MRNPEYEFVSTDAAALEATLISEYERITGITVRPAGPEKLFIEWVTSVILHERVMTNWAANQNIPSRAEGENLDALGELYYATPRPEAQPAFCTVRFYISEAQETSILIPAGTRVTDISATTYWATAADAYVAIGATYADVQVKCQTPGKSGNGWSIGQINTAVDIYDYYSACSNITVSEGGADRATDDEYYQLLRTSMDAYSCAGSRESYIYYAKRVSTEISDVCPNRPDDGCVAIYTLMKDGTAAGTEIKNAVLASCSAAKARPLTDYVTAEDPEEEEYNIDITYYIPSDSSKSSADIATDINSVIDAYTTWQSEKFGRDINPSRLESMLMTTGIKRVVIREPIVTVLRDGKNNLVPQMAKLGDVTIVNGGYEDE